jgi:Raf kinase inhibitor-like YbhB/YbcL family protein
MKTENCIMPLKLASKGFDAGRDIPAMYTCDGQNISPPLAWFDVPAAAKSLALIVDDPDAPNPAAPQRVWTHWVVYNIPADAAGLLEGVTPEGLPPGAKEGLNDWQQVGYGGPCPPIGQHRYFHKLYALDTVLPDLGNPTKSDLEVAMQDHVIAQAELIGRYQRHS